MDEGGACIGYGDRFVDLQALVCIYRRSLRFISAHPDLSAPARTYRRSPRFISACANLSAFTQIYQRLYEIISAYLTFPPHFPQIR